jgi:hypothetical protein
MRPRRVSSRQPSATTQMPLPLQGERILTLDSNGRRGVVAALACLLLEAVGPARDREGGDDAQ